MANQELVMGNSLDGDLALIAALAATLAGAKAKLFKDTLAPTPETEVAAFAAAEATFAGYAAVVVTWSPAVIGTDQKVRVVSSRALFQATDGVTPNSIGGFWLETAAGGLLRYCVFTSPINMAAALAFIAAVLEFGITDPGVVSVDY